MEKTKEEILNEFGCPVIPFDENVTMYYPAIISAMEEYGQQQRSLGFEEGKRSTISVSKEDGKGYNYDYNPHRPV